MDARSHLGVNIYSVFREDAEYPFVVPIAAQAAPTGAGLQSMFGSSRQVTQPVPEPMDTVRIYAACFPGRDFLGTTSDGDYYTALIRDSPVAIDALLTAGDVVYCVESDGALLCVITSKKE